MQTTIRRDGTVFLNRIPGKIVSTNVAGGNIYAIRKGAPPVEISYNGQMRELDTFSPEKSKALDEARCFEEF